jgi:tetratricopeptide (TPR) repeat protein
MDPLRQYVARDPALARALDDHRAGRAAAAQAAYEAVLQARPTDPEALLLLAALTLERGDPDSASALLQRLIAAVPGSAPGHYLLGQCYRALRRVPDATGCFREAARLAPDYVDAHFSLGLLYCEREDWRAAIPCFREVLRLRPDYPEAYSNLGTALQECGAFEEAVRSFQAAIRLNPGYHEAHFNLGNAYQEMGNLGSALDAYREAARVCPGFPAAHNNLGGILQRRGNLEEAEQSYAAALRLDPRYEKAHNGLGLVRFERGHIAAAIEHYRHALQLKPDFAEAHLNLALALLVTGRLREGWQEYEWRKRAGTLRIEWRHQDKPLWRGEPLAGKTILLHAEQGLGDTIQFARFACVLAAQGARVLLEVEPPLYELCGRSLSGVEVFATGEPLPAFDCQCPLLSVPRALDVTLETIPAPVPYLFADDARASEWRRRMGAHAGLRVGLAWAGSATHRYDRNRSFPGSTLRPLLQVGGTQFYSLQKGPAAAQARTLDAGDALIDWSDELATFADTAALVAHLDLVVTADTAVAHLAGAMGKPVWVLTPFAPEWRWLLERADTPWYPTMRLFRQRRAGDWHHVVEAVRAALTALCESRPAPAAAPDASGESRRRKRVIAQRATDLARWSDERQLDPMWGASRDAPPDHIPAGSSVLDWAAAQ